jgi:membrane protein
MKLIEGLKKRIQATLTTPAEELARWQRMVRFQIHLWRTCGRRLREHNAITMSAALSFRTIFALIPLLVLSLLAVKALGLAEVGEESIREFVIDQFAGIDQSVDAPTTMPTTAPAEDGAPNEQLINISRRIGEIVDSVNRKLTLGTVGPVGVAVLIWTALTLLMTVEHSLNDIFGAPHARSFWRTVILYWTVITLGPVLLSVASWAGGRLAVAFEEQPGLDLVLSAVGWAGPALLGIVILAAIYKLMPNTHVRYKSAIGGAVVAVPLWLVAKWGFGLYVRHLVIGGANLYGSLGALPLFFFWLNLSWLIFLFGAELAHTATHLETLRLSARSEDTLLGPEDLVAAAVAIARSFQRGRGPVHGDELARRLNLPHDSVRRLMHRLISAGLVVSVGGQDEETPPAYALARPAERIQLAELLGLDGLDARGSSIGRAARPDGDALGRVRSSLEAVTLADLAAGDPAEQAAAHTGR